MELDGDAHSDAAKRAPKLQMLGNVVVQVLSVGLV